MLQGVWKLYAEIERKKAEGTITADTPEVSSICCQFHLLANSGVYT